MITSAVNDSKHSLDGMGGLVWFVTILRLIGPSSDLFFFFGRASFNDFVLGDLVGGGSHIRRV